MKDCIFCKIVAGKLPSKKVLETDGVIVFHDINPAAPTHMLIVPKKHIEKLSDAKKGDKAILGEIQLVATRVANKLGIKKAFRLVTLSGAEAGQTVFHLHYHLLGWKKQAPTWFKNQK